MNRKFKNSYRGGWNDNMPFDDVNQGEAYYDYEIPHDRGNHYADDSYLSHETPAHYADKRHLPDQKPAHYSDERQHQRAGHYADERHLIHQRPEHYSDRRFLGHQIPEDYADKRCSPHEMAHHYADGRHLPQQTPKLYGDRRHLSHQMPEDYVDNRHLPCRTPEYYAEKERYFPHQTEEYFADKKRYFSHQTEEYYADKKRCFSPQTEELYADTNRYFAHQTEEHLTDKKRYFKHQTEEYYADKKRYFSHQAEEHHADVKRCISPQTEEYYAHKKRCFPPQTEEYYADKKRYFSPQTEEYYADKNRYFGHQTEEHFADKRHSPQQIPKDYAGKRRLSRQKSEDYAHKKRLPLKMPDHYDDKRYLAQKKLKNYGDKRHLLHQTPEDYPDNRRSPHRMQKHYADKKRHLPHPTKEHYADKKRHLPLQMEEHYAVKKRHLPHQMQEDYVDKKCLSHQSPEPTIYDVNKHQMKHNTSNGEHSRQIPNSSEMNPVVQPKKDPKSKKNGHPVENVSFEAPSFKHKKVPAENSKREHGDHTGAKDHGFKVENVKNEAPKHKKVPAENSKRKLGDDTGTKDCCFKVENVKNKAPSFKNKTVPAESSKRKLRDDTTSKDHGFKTKAGGATGGKYLKMNNGIRRPVKSSKPVGKALSNSVESLVRVPELNPPSGHAASPIGSRTSAAAKGSTFDPKSHIDSQREETEAKEHHEVQNHGVDSNDEQRSNSMELNDSAGSMTNTKTEVVNSYSESNKIVTEPFASAPSDAIGSQPQESEAVANYESQHPTDETNIELRPSVLMEIDPLSECSVENETTDGSSQAEAEMDVLANESGITKLPQVSVCLTCGHKGFEEALVYCKKCEDCALHRYCLDGQPVIFTDEVIWFCEDCETEVVDKDYPDNETTHSAKGEVDSNKECLTVVDPQPIADPIWSGSLQVLNKSYDNISTKLMCHLSTLACPNVLEETRHLPNVLYADMIQRSAVWPESFRKFGTNNLSIGLYFFPQNERDERYFDQQVDEMISNDLAIRAKVEKAELLIFPSTMLPSQYKRFQSKYYLWGIFKKASKQSSTI